MPGGSSVRWDLHDPFSHGHKKVPMPEASDGKCKGCGRWAEDLGDMYCRKCWDIKSGIKTREEDDSDDALQSES